MGLSEKNLEGKRLINRGRGLVEVDEVGGDGLTVKQAAFVQEFTKGQNAGNGLRSAVAVGYSEKTAGSIACALLKHSAVVAAVDAALRAELSGPLTAQSIAVMRRIIGDEEAPLKLRGDMAARVVEFSGIVDRVRVEKARQTGLDGSQGAGVKRLGEMTREELEAVCRSGASILQAAAALPPAGQVIEGSNREPFTITQPAIEQNPSAGNALEEA